MSKKRILCIAAAGIVILGLLTFFCLHNRSLFDGDRAATSDSYILDFKKMNQEDYHILTLKKGDVLSVEFSIGKGDVDFIIAGENGEPIYKGNGIEDGKFEVTVPEDGDYRVLVRASHASGAISVKTE